MNKTVLTILACAGLIAGIFTYFYKTVELTGPDTDQIMLPPSNTTANPMHRAEVRPNFRQNVHIHGENKK